MYRRLRKSSSIPGEKSGRRMDGALGFAFYYSHILVVVLVLFICWNIKRFVHSSSTLDLVCRTSKNGKTFQLHDSHFISWDVKVVLMIS